MKNILRNIAAVIVGIIAGGAVNMAIVTFGPSVIPPPPGVDVTNTESIAASMHLFQPKHFAVPFLAHALGTLAGALIVCLAAASNQARLPYVVGAVFFIGGIAASIMIPAPLWFIVLDLAVAYFPMSWLAIKLGQRISC